MFWSLASMGQVDPPNLQKPNNYAILTKVNRLKPNMTIPLDLRPNINHLPNASELGRSEVFKDERNTIVVAANELLAQMAYKRDKNEPLSDGPQSSAEDKITEVAFGGATKLVAIGYELGISLTGDGKEFPYILHIVRGGTGGVDAMEIIGTDPIQKFNGPEYSSEHREDIVARWSYTTNAGTHGDEQFFQYTVHGDGSVMCTYKTNEHQTKKLISTLEELEIARESLDLIRSEL